MDSTPETTTTNYQQVTVDVPEDRVAEFHAFFARFLEAAGRHGRGRGRHGRHGRHEGHRGRHGHGCGRGPGAAEQGEGRGETAGPPVESTEL
jgi:hypothetical protein